MGAAPFCEQVRVATDRDDLGDRPRQRWLRMVSMTAIAI